MSPVAVSESGPSEADTDTLGIDQAPFEMTNWKEPLSEMTERTERLPLRFSWK